MEDRSQQPVLFGSFFRKSVELQFDGEAQSSDGGVLLVAALDRQLGLTAALAAELRDGRQPGKVDHSLKDLVRQRVYSLALGYADGNDAARLAGDPALKIACGRKPASDGDLASQPTLSRFENAPGARELVAMGRSLERHAIASLRRRHARARAVWIDLDGTDDPTHGSQQLTFFHGYYDCHCYLPLLGFLSVDDFPEQYLFAARLRPGKSSQTRGVIPLLRRVVAQLRKAFPRAEVRVRLDAGFAHPRIFDELDRLKVGYLVSFAANAVLDRLAVGKLYCALLDAREERRSVRHFGWSWYRAKGWKRDRRVIFKAEALCVEGKALKENPRFVVTNLRGRPEDLYGEYCRRGDSENRIKELQLDLEMERTSCSRFRANQLRVLCTAAAYMLMQELRWRLRRTELRRAQVGTLRLKLLKIGVRVLESVRRIVLHAPRAYPWQALWRQLALSVGAASG